MGQKYTQQIKRSALQAYLDGQGGMTCIAQTHNVNVASLRKWIADYRHHGFAAIEDRNALRNRYTLEFKISVIHRVRDEGLSDRQAAALFNIRNFNTISEWIRRYEEGGVDALADRRKKNPDKGSENQDLGDSPSTMYTQLTREQLVAEIERMSAENAYLKKLNALIQAAGQSLPRKR